MTEQDEQVETLLIQLHGLGFHGKDLAHLETLADFIIADRTAHKNQLLDRVERDVIGEDEHLGNKPYKPARNEFRAEQRKAISKLREETK